MVNKVILIGNLGQDPEQPRKVGDTCVLDISIATVRRVKNGENQTDWHTITCWGNTVQFLGSKNDSAPAPDDNGVPF
mgnify:CR=1 FL=1